MGTELMTRDMEGEGIDPRAREIGGRIAEARKALNMHQEELAELLHVSLRSVQGYELGETVPYRRMKDLERVFGKTTEWFLHGDQGIGSSEQLQEIAALLREIRDYLARG